MVTFSLSQVIFIFKLCGFLPEPSTSHRCEMLLVLELPGGLAALVVQWSDSTRCA